MLGCKTFEQHCLVAYIVLPHILQKWYVFLGFKLPKRKTARVSSSVCFFVALFVRKRALFLYPFSLVLPATICQGGTKFLPRSRLPSWTKKKRNPKAGFFPLPPIVGASLGYPTIGLCSTLRCAGNFSKKSKHSSTAKQATFWPYKNKIKPRTLKVVMYGSSRRKCGGRVSCVRFHQKQESKMRKSCFD